MRTNDPRLHHQMNLRADHFQLNASAAVQDIKPAGRLAPAVAHATIRFARMAAAQAASAAISSAVGATRLAGKTAALFRSRTPVHDELGELIEASRYAIISNRLAALAALTPEEQQTVRRSTPDRRIHQAGSELVGEGENAMRPMLIVSGWVCRVRVASGRRQIVSLLLPGDGIALHGGSGALSTTTVTALTMVETVDARPLLDLADRPDRNPGISAAMHRMLSLEKEFLFNQVTRLGAMPEPQRLMHLLLELHWRLKQARIATPQEAPLPIGEETLADMLAMKPRAVGAVMRHLRRQKLVRTTPGRMALPDTARLTSLAEFAPPPPLVRIGARRLICDAGVAMISPAISAKPVATATPPHDPRQGRPATL